MRKLFRLVLLIFILAVIFDFGKDYIGKSLVEKGIKSFTSLDVKIDDFDVGITGTTIGMSGCTIYNPNNFFDRVMIDVPDIYVDYDLKSILADKIHIREARIYLKDFIIVRNSYGEVNVEYLRTAIRNSHEEKVVRRTSSADEPGNRREVKTVSSKIKSKKDVKIDNLELKIGRVVYKDYTAGEVPRVLEFRLNLRERFKDIDSGEELVKIITSRALADSAIQAIANLDIDKLKLSTDNVVRKSKKAWKETKDFFKLAVDDLVIGK